MLTTVPASVPKLSDAVWIDLVDPTEEERQEVERGTGFSVPSKADIEEIESSSRVYMDNGVLYLSSPILEHTDCINAKVAAVGFALSKERLATLRFGKVGAFDMVLAGYEKAKPASAQEAFLKIIETIIDQAADALEHGSADLERISHASFHVEQPHRHRRAKTSEALRGALRRLGRMGDGLSHVRDTLLGLGRIATFVHEHGRPALSPADTARFDSVRADIASLDDYQAHLSNKVQFLLDATLGFINIEQNDVVKTLTVVSVVGVPPVLIAGIYGMNFHNMPELSWSFGYPYSLVLIVVSGLLPLVWFRWRGWL